MNYFQLFNDLFFEQKRMKTNKQHNLKLIVQFNVNRKIIRHVSTYNSYLIDDLLNKK
jgi:hypothetical protein